MGLRKLTNNLITYTNLHKPNNKMVSVATLLLKKWEDDTHTPEMGTWESTGTLETSEFDCRGKLLKCRCQKWACMNHLDICSTSYDKKKGRESNCQFDCHNPTLAKCGGEVQHLEKVRIWSPLGLPNVQSSTERPKTPRIEVFLVSLERS
jgi:hypothetical protein